VGFRRRRDDNQDRAIVIAGQRRRDWRPGGLRESKAQ
jgi:hypothetical protein